MSADLKDFRGEITRETDVWLEAEERIHGRTRQSVVRELLHAHAEKRLHEAKVMMDLAAAHGVLPEDSGTSRNAPARARRT